MKLIVETITHEISEENWYMLKQAYKAQDWESLDAFSGSYEIGYKTLIRELEKETGIAYMEHPKSHC